MYVKDCHSDVVGHDEIIFENTLPTSGKAIF